MTCGDTEAAGNMSDRYRLIFVTEEHHEEAFRYMALEGYPWDDSEYYHVTMIRVMYGEETAGWIWFDWADAQTAGLHVCIGDEHRGRVASRRVFDKILFAAEMMGIRRVYALAGLTDARKYVERLGWSCDDIGYFVDI